MDYQERQQIGHYGILAPLGSGGIGTAYRAVDMLPGARQVVIKISPINSNEALQHESKILGLLHHPNILRTIEFGEEADISYLVNEYMDGGNLGSRHPSHTRVPLLTVISYTKQVASALQYMHDRGIVHRDVKPENMFINAEGRVVLGDFGIAIILSNEISGVQIAGTLKYMAPEQIQGQAQRASDQYALGIVVYEWLSGEAPFSGAGGNELLFKHVRERPTPLSAIVPEIPRPVGAVVMRALEKNPRNRYPSVQAFADALEQASRPINLATPTGSAPEWTFRTKDTSNALESIYATESASVNIPDSTTLSSSVGEEKEQQDTELSLFAIARTTLEQDDRAIVGNTYTVQAGISQQKVEDFRSAPFKISVQDPSQPILFHILFHPSKNIQMMGPPYQRLRYNPDNTVPQFTSCPFRLQFPGRSYLLINFYRERQWLKTIRFEFDGIEQSISSTARDRR